MGFFKFKSICLKLELQSVSLLDLTILRAGNGPMESHYQSAIPMSSTELTIMIWPWTPVRATTVESYQFIPHQT